MLQHKLAHNPVSLLIHAATVVGLICIIFFALFKLMLSVIGC